MKEYIIGIGKRIKEIRKSNKKTINEIASKADVSNGLISRIENGRTIPSLPVLFNIIKALEVEVTYFFLGIPNSNGSSYILTRSSEFSVIEKEDDAQGFLYKFIFNKQLSSIGFEAVLLEISPNSKRDKVITEAFEFKYMVSGSCNYIIGEDEVTVNEGDALFFDGRIPHVPVNKSDQKAKMLVMYFYL
ncbi:helix-turn-helix domain-containing protein [Salegentibacter maritimus]|uniref:helix-turn-helix domain-containing protein n=1 Tax=Salegentibacter maritimus TaxID=2794347 RepID=UPI0018E4C548|nr:XRE family transcriptional regulator [Salegentibacter maritimus]MBI6118019.1 helix-turn-helix transcriptional regulator [Salegentibacter maritimus]